MDVQSRGNRRGFALPVVILAMFLLVGALASGFAMIRGERAADDAVIQLQSAQAIAESGLQQAFTNRTGLGVSGLPTNADTGRLTIAGSGYAEVITTRLRAPVGTTVPGLYYIRSRGVRTRTGVAGAGDAVAVATAFASFAPMNLTIQSAMTGINGINKSGSSGVISGLDNCPLAQGGGQPSLPAVAVPANPGYTGSLTPLEGSQRIDTLASTEVGAAEQVPIDWENIVENGAVTADFYVKPDGTGWPGQAWFDANPTRYPTIIIENGPNPETMFVVNGFGRGTLIVYGSVWFQGNTGGWDGIVIVGGRLRSSGGNQVSGATITGLNVKLGYNVGENEVNELSGTKKFLYHSCNVSRALQSFNTGSLRAYQNSWGNTFPMY